ncbi:MAG TPA: shikimate kinase, partial [Longimicrobiaceae bacterium]|nr:shikimate kinase [Longimicrobiaceae bacterium]
LGRGTLSIWLQVSPAETVARLRNDDIDRPLKHHPDPLSRVSEMIAAREPLLSRADVHIPTDGREVAEIVAEVERVVGNFEF